MKKQLFGLFTAVLTSLSLSAQVTEGSVKYSIDMQSDNPEMAMAISMMQGSTLAIYFKDNKSRTEMSMGSLMNTVIISDSDKKETLTLMSGMMGNTAVRSTYEETEANTEEMPDINIEITDETKEILGYTCKKAIMTADEGSENIFWFTEEISANKEGQTMLSEKVPGFPLAMEVNANGMIMNMMATGLEKKVKDKSLFDMTIPEGYTETTTEELMNSFQGGE